MMSETIVQSLLCLLSKVLERLVYNNIINSIKGTFSKHQFGFIEGRSCLQQLLLYLNTIVEAHERMLQQC